MNISSSIAKSYTKITHRTQTLLYLSIFIQPYLFHGNEWQFSDEMYKVTSQA